MLIILFRLWIQIFIKNNELEAKLLKQEEIKPLSDNDSEDYVNFDESDLGTSSNDY